jgi:hypothetical protein
MILSFFANLSKKKQTFLKPVFLEVKTKKVIE